MPYQEYKHSFKNQFRTMASLTVYRTGRQQCGAGPAADRRCVTFISSTMSSKAQGFTRSKVYPTL